VLSAPWGIIVAIVGIPAVGYAFAGLRKVFIVAMPEHLKEKGTSSGIRR
jgi:hypothetical protein